MSQHPSLKSSKVGNKLRSVLKRYERFFTLKDKGILQDESSVFGLPKLKIVRTKIKKEKTAEKPEEGAAAAGAEGAPAVPQKEAAPKAEKKRERKK
ncbi:MAG: small basic protein [Candidatus Omnitrophica bacterium]|nr:small basic protein [Candidatus Omnitrophota bacterium]